MTFANLHFVKELPIWLNRRDRISSVDAAEGIENMDVFVKRPWMA